MENVFNTYLFKALDAYPYELEEAIEALNYALSFEPENAKALCLLARVYTEQLGDYSAAKSCYEKAMSSQMEMPSIYPDFIRLLLVNEDYEQAQRLIDFALTVKGTDKATLHLLQGQLYEGLGQLTSALSALKRSKTFAYNNDFVRFADEEIQRVKNKLPKKGRKKKKSPKKKGE